jgi:hypothetical protein
MKADVAFAPKLSIPRWVPKAIAQFVRAEYAADVLGRYALVILSKPSAMTVSDPRMRGVWHQLLRRKSALNV